MTALWHSAHQWGCQGSLNAPSKRIQAMSNHWRGQPSDTRPFCYDQSSAVEFQPVVVALVVRLLSHCRPSNIANFVMAVGVDAVNRMGFRRTRPDSGENVLNELFAVVYPRCLHVNTASAIVKIGRVFWAIAALLDSGPQAIERSFAQSVRAAHVADPFSVQAPAAVSSVGPVQHSSADNLARAAIAQALPSHRVSAGYGFDGQPSYASAVQVNRYAHSAILGRNTLYGKDA